MNACRLASVALALAGWFVSGQAQTGCKSNDPAGYFEGTATSQHEGKLDVSLNLRCDSGRYAGELVTPVGTYAVKDSHFEANLLHLNLDSGGDSVTIEAAFDAGVLRGKFVAAADTGGPVELNRTGDARNPAAAAGNPQSVQATVAPGSRLSGARTPEATRQCLPLHLSRRLRCRGRPTQRQTGSPEQRRNLRWHGSNRQFDR